MSEDKVYLDPLCNHGWRLGPNSHLFVSPGTPLETLHAFAEEIGMRRVWFQNKPGRTPHYDVTASRRERALKLGAIELTRPEAVTIFRQWRK
jgi:hypothetical protein